MHPRIFVPLCDFITEKPFEKVYNKGTKGGQSNGQLKQNELDLPRPLPFAGAKQNTAVLRWK